MSLQVLTANDVKIYNVSAGKALPDWLTASSKAKKNIAYRKRVELIQDFEFPVAATKLKFTPDGTHIIATGVYKPQMRVYDLAQLSLKFDRHMSCETVQFQILSDDWTKVVFLQTDRSIDFHTQFGFHHRTRIPRFGRDMAYDERNADLLIVGASDNVWRLNLEEGRYMQPLVTHSNAINVCKVNPAHGLYAFGGQDGRVELWDPRVRSCLGTLEVGAAIVKSHYDQQSLPEISSMAFDTDGLTMAVGSSSGHILLYDLRHSSPLITKDHQYGCAIKDIKFHASSKTIISADRQTIRIWHKMDGKSFTSIETDAHINDVAVYPDTGLVLVATETSKMGAYYIPSLGAAPRWCAFLDNLTEELEERPSTAIYDDYKFVTKMDLSELGLDHLIGTNLLRAHMHGFFIDVRLYEKAKLIANPFSYDEYKQKQIQEKLEKERSSRILSVKKLPKINRKLAEKLLQQESQRDSADPLGDARFSAIFSNPDYQIQEESEEYQRLHPNEKRAAIQSLFERDENEEEEEEEEEEDLYDLNDLEEKDHSVTKQIAALSSSESDNDMDEIFESRINKKKVKEGGAKPRELSSAASSFYSLKKGVPLQNVLKLPLANQQKGGLKHLSMADRLAAMEAGGLKEETGEDAPRLGAMSMNFHDKGGAKKGNKNSVHQKQQPTKNVARERRGVKELKLKRMPTYQRR